jgi:hypothetical protein
MGRWTRKSVTVVRLFMRNGSLNPHVSHCGQVTFDEWVVEPVCQSLWSGYFWGMGRWTRKSVTVVRLLFDEWVVEPVCQSLWSGYFWGMGRWTRKSVTVVRLFLMNGSLNPYVGHCGQVIFDEWVVEPACQSLWSGYLWGMCQVRCLRNIKR